MLSMETLNVMEKRVKDCIECMQDNGFSVIADCETYNTCSKVVIPTEILMLIEFCKTIYKNN
jgi:hypothetical protein